SNTRGSENIISNGSKILVPQGYGLITVVDGRATGLITEAGGYEFSDSSPDARSVFAGDEVLASTVEIGRASCRARRDDLDRIRDRNVTGVQTCALPISRTPAAARTSSPTAPRSWCPRATA